MQTYLIVLPLVFLAGFIDAIAGGGGLISLPSYILAGLPIHNCLACNKMSSCMGTTVATGIYIKSGFVPWRLALLCIPCAFGGSTIGARIALTVSDHFFKILMLFLLPLIAYYVLRHRIFCEEEIDMAFVKRALLSMGIAFAVGIYDGFFGPGTGTFLILLLSVFAKMKLQQANGLTKMINFSTNVAALSVFLLNGQVLFPLGIIAGVFNIAGNTLGARVFKKGASSIIRPMLIVVLVLFWIKLAWELFF